jgi:hypothetical protein
MNCEECRANGKACERVRDINGAIGSMDCDKTLDKIRWSVKTLNIQGWALERYRILMDMLAENREHIGDRKSRLKYVDEERKKVEAAMKEQWGKSP